MELSKIHLSSEELMVMKNEEWILTKNRAVDKLVYAMSLLGMQMKARAEVTQGLLQPAWTMSNPKVSKGEKYKGLPYLMLDYPRDFGREHIFAIRTMFWWGHYCSITLHVRGKYLQPIAENAVSRVANGFWISTSGDEWNHDLASSDYRTLAGGAMLQLEEHALNGFLKIAAKVELDQWDKMEFALWNYYLLLLKVAGC